MPKFQNQIQNFQKSQSLEYEIKSKLRLRFSKKKNINIKRPKRKKKRNRPLEYAKKMVVSEEILATISKDKSERL